MKQTYGGTEDAVVAEVLALLATLESALAHYQARIHSTLGRALPHLQAPFAPSLPGGPASSGVPHHDGVSPVPANVGTLPTVNSHPSHSLPALGNLEP